MKQKLLVSIPFTGLGMYGGFRGNRWLRNRIKIFKQFVVPSLLAQTDQDFILWVCWRRDEKTNKQVIELEKYLKGVFPQVIFTYTGITFWDDKFEDSVAREKLFNTLRLGLPELFDTTAGAEEIIWLLQPSDDCYDRVTVDSVKRAFQSDDSMQAIAYTQGYLCNYNTLEILEYNPKTSPPFHAIRFPREIFFDAGKHMTYISLKEDVAQYKAGTPCPSHEYLPRCLKTATFNGRGFLVGTHGENISTHFNHPYGGEKVPIDILHNYGLQNIKPLVLPVSIRKKILRKLPYRWQRKLRYIFGEMFVNKIYEWLRN